MLKTRGCMKNKKINTFRKLLLLNIFLCGWMLSFTVNSEILKIDETCTVSILNRSVQASADGKWQIDNVPSFMGQVRARATCLRDGLTLSGQTGFRTVDTNVLTVFGEFETVLEDVVPVSLDFTTGNNAILFGDKTYFKLRVFANYADGARKDVTLLASGINYTISNPNIATIDQNGVLQGLSSGRVLITARKDGAIAALSVTIVTTGDSDNDGLPDDFELENGLNPNDAADASEDQDNDALSALNEFFSGTDLNNSDSDNDGILDGEELASGLDGFITNPLLADSDSDGINDNLEISVGTDPTDINSVNIASSIAGLSVVPKNAVLTFNSIQGADASIQLNVEGTTIDGKNIDLTPLSKGTNYSSSELTICNFGGEAGEVFAGSKGNCIVTADNSGFSDTSDIDVRSFDPIPLNFVIRDDEPKAIAVEQGIAYIGTNKGLQIIDVSNPLAPIIKGSVLLGSNVTSVIVKGEYVYLATSTAALVVVNVADINAPAVVTYLGGTVAASDLAIVRNELYIATGTNGLWVVNISNPLAPRKINTFQANVAINAVAVSETGEQVVIADGNQLRLIIRRGSGLFSEGGNVTLGNPLNIEIAGNIAYVADLTGTLTLVNIIDSMNPFVSSVPASLESGRPRDVAIAGKFAFLADTSFPNGVPIIDVSNPSAAAARAVIDFTTLGLAGADAYAIDVDNQYIYTVTTQGLQIAQFQEFIDENNNKPRIQINQPVTGESALEGGVIKVISAATDDVAIAKVKFYADGELLYTDIAPPYEYLMPLPIAAAETVISVQAIDYGGNESDIDSVNITLLADSDFDGLSDNDETTIHGTSPFEADTDNDGLTDLTEINLGYDPLDSDIDNDGLLDGEEVRLGLDGYITNLRISDTDNDGMLDGYESKFGLNPLDANDASEDPDNDGLSNLEEFLLGFDPTTADSDQDGMPDVYERKYGLDPFNSDDFFGDLDDDGVPNGVEYKEGTDPTNPDVIGPKVVSLTPESGVNLPTNLNVLVHFNEAIKLESLSEITVTMIETADPSKIVEGTISLSADGLVLSYNPVINFAIDTEYSFSFSGARDLAGNLMRVVFSTAITTGSSSDITAPEQLSVNLLNGSKAVATNIIPILSYSEAIDSTGLDASGLYIYDTLLGQKVPGSIGLSSDSMQVFVIPESQLLVGRSYYLYVSNIKDLAGNSCSNCGNNQRIYFTTSFDVDNVAPKVLATNLVNGAVNAPLNAPLIIKFDELISPLLLSNIALINNTQNVQFSYALSSDRRTVTITPFSLLLPGAAYSLAISGIEDLSGNKALDVDLSFTAGSSVDSTSGSILNWSIPNNATDIALNALLEIEFSERVDSSSINTNSFYLYDTTADRKVPRSWSLSNNDTTLRLIPDAALEPGHSYYIRTQYLTDLAGNGFPYGISYFSTGITTDQIAPALVQTNVEQGSAVAISSRLIIKLDENISDGCRPEAKLTSTTGDIQLSIAIGSDRKTLTLTPLEALSVSSDYSLAVSNLCDYAGNQYSASDIVSFTSNSAVEPDTTAPTFVSMTPAVNANNISVNTKVIITFSEPIDKTIQAIITGGGLSVSGSSSVQGNELTFTPTVALQGGTQYQVSLNRNITDTSGNTIWLGSKYFTTETLIDTIAPTLKAVSPVSDAVGVAPGATMYLTFSEPMNPGTITGNNIALYTDGNIILPSIARSADGQQVSLRANLPSSSIVSIILTDGLTDLSGNAINPIASTFITAAVDTDNVKPSVVQQLPKNGSKNLFNRDQIVLLMNEPMDAASVEQALHVSSNGTLIPGTVSLSTDNRAITFTSDTPFSEGAYVQVFLESFATDESGNAAYNYDGYIQMGVTDELIGTAAVFTASSPYSGQQNVTLNPVIMAQYSEPLDALALENAFIDLRTYPEGISVPINSALDSTGKILQITLQELLSANSGYRLYLDDMSDNDGDINTRRYSVIFTTAENAVQDNRQPVALSVSPPNGATNVGLNVNYSVRFDEPMNPLTLTNDQLTNVLFSENNQVIRYQRRSLLPAETEKTESLPVIQDLSGNAVVAANNTFTTAVIPDVVKGDLIASTSGTVATNPVIAWVANEAIDPVSITSSGVYLYDTVDGSVVATTIALSADGHRIEIVPMVALQVGHDYYYKANHLRDLSGNVFSNRTSYFTTSFANDNLAPRLIDSTVVDGQAEVPSNARFTIRFSEPLSTFDTSGISLTNSTATKESIQINFNSIRTKVTVRPNRLLDALSSYTLTVSGMKDISGNVQATDYVANFTTADTADLKTGSILNWSIPNNATDIALNALLEIEFSERVDSSSINTNSFYLYDTTADRKVPRSWSLSNNDTTLRLIPDAALEPGHSYYIRTQYLTDLAGNGFPYGISYFSTAP